MAEERKMRSDVKIFIEKSENPEETKKVLIALSDRPVLTNEVVEQILTDSFNWTKKRAERFVRALHFCDFVKEGNFDEFSVGLYEN